MPNVTRLSDRKSGPPEQRRRYRGIAVGPRGQRETKIFPRKDIALAWAVRREEELRKPADPDSRLDPGVTLAEWAPQALPKMRLAPGTRRNYERYTAGYLLPAWGDRRLTSLRVSEVEQWLDRLVTDPQEGDVRADKVGRAVAPSSAASILGALKALLREAVRADLIRQSPLIGTRAPSIPDPQPRFMRESDALAVIGELPPWASTFALLLLYTGLRPQEARALEPEHLDVDRGMLLVRGVVGEGDSCAFDWSPLTKGKRHREVPLPGQVARAVRVHLATAPPADVALLDRQGKQVTKRLVFRGPDGGPVCRHDLRDAWVTATKKAGVPVHRVYDLRHTYASLLISSGATLSEVGELLGHRPGSPATAVYAWLMGEYKSKVRAALERP